MDRLGADVARRHGRGSGRAVDPCHRSRGDRRLGVLIAILARHFTAGVVVGERAAPIVHYMARWDMAKISSYCRSKGWRIEVIGD